MYIRISSKFVVGYSTCIVKCFTGNSRPPRNEMKSIFVGNGSTNTSVTSLRQHLNSIGLSDNVADIQTVNTKYPDAKFFCVTLNSINAESVWPDRVIIIISTRTQFPTPTSGKDIPVPIRTTQIRSHTIRRPTVSGLNNIEIINGITLM